MTGQADVRAALDEVVAAVKVGDVALREAVRALLRARVAVLAGRGEIIEEIRCWDRLALTLDDAEDRALAAYLALRGER